MFLLDIVCLWLGRINLLVLLLVLLFAGLPPGAGRAPHGVLRCLLYQVGVVLCRHDLQQRLMARLEGRGYRFIGQGRWRMGWRRPGGSARPPAD